VLQGSFVFDVGVFILPAYAVAALVALRVYRRDTRIRTRPDRVLSWMLALTAVSIPAALVLRSRFPLVDSGFRYSTARPFMQFGVLCVFILLYRVVVATSATPTLYRRALRFFLLLASVVAGYAIYQQIAYRAGLPLVTLPGPSGLGRVLVAVLPAGGSTFRSNATFVELLDLGRYLIATSLVALSLLMGRTSIGISRRSLSTILGLQLVALVLTFSSSAYLGLVAGILTAVVVAKRRLRLLVGLIVVVDLIGYSASAVSVWLLQGEVSTRDVIASRGEQAFQIETEEGGNPAYEGFRRTGYWLASIQMAARRPLTGVGIGNFGASAVALNPGLVPEAGWYGAFSGWLGEFGIPGLLVCSRWSSYCSARSGGHMWLIVRGGQNCSAFSRGRWASSCSISSPATGA
jgi:O-antigen ligase